LYCAPRPPPSFPTRRSSDLGCPNDFHLVHYGTRAEGGAGLVYTEMTCVSPTGRITPGCTGMYAPEHETAWKRIVDFVHGHSKAKDRKSTRLNSSHVKISYAV